MKDRVILHCDCNAYFASVECIDRPELKLVPMAVCGDPKSRHGIILAKNELAKACGVTTAEPIWQAQRKCKDLVLIVPHHSKYEEYCKIINDIYAEYTDQVEAFSIDESWLDVTGSQHLFGTGTDIANALRARLREEIGLTISVGVSFNKTFAKIGSDYKKPDATTVITRENYMDIVWPLPASDMMYVGAHAMQALLRNGIHTIGDIALSGRSVMRDILGRQGEDIWERASGIDDSPVRFIGDKEAPKSVGRGITFSRDLTGIEDIRAGLMMVCDSVGTRLRRHNMYCSTVQVQIKDPYLKTIQRQRALDNATDATKDIFDTALSIVLTAWPVNAPIRMLTVTASNLTDECRVQVSLIEDNLEKRKKNARIDSAVDSIRGKYGKTAIKAASSYKSDLIYRGEDSGKEKK